MLLLCSDGFKESIVSKSRDFCFCLSFHKGVAHYSYGTSILSCFYNTCCQSAFLQKLFSNATITYNFVGDFRYFYRDHSFNTILIRRLNSDSSTKYPKIILIYFQSILFCCSILNFWWNFHFQP